MASILQIDAADASPVERVALYLAGTSRGADEDAIAATLHRRIGFWPTQVVLQPQRVAKVILEGAGSIAAAARLEGAHSDQDPFKMCSFDNDWFCPCGRSGQAMLSFGQHCPSCGGRRPGGIAKAAAAVPTPYTPATGRQSTLHPPALACWPLPNADSTHGEGVHFAMGDQFAQDDACAATAFELRAPRAPLLPHAQTPPIAPHPSPAQHHQQPASSEQTRPLALPPPVLHPPPSQTSRLQQPAAKRARGEDGGSHVYAHPAARAERVELFLGGVHSKDPQPVEVFLRRLTRFGHVVRVMPTGRPGSMRATLEGPGACRAAANAAGKVPRARDGRSEGRCFEELKMHLDWYCSCAASDQIVHKDHACPSCGRSKPMGLNEAAEAVEAVEEARAAHVAPAARAAQAPPSRPPHEPYQTHQLQARPVAPPLNLSDGSGSGCGRGCGNGQSGGRGGPGGGSATRGGGGGACGRDGPGSTKPTAPLSSWNQVLGGAALAKELFRRPLIYDSLDQCLQICAANNGSARDGTDDDHTGIAPWRAWAFDLPCRAGVASAGAPKKYIAATVDDFIGRYERLAPAERHVYELIEAQHPCWAYFDLEYERGGLNADVDGDALSGEIARVASEMLVELATTARDRLRRQLLASQPDTAATQRSSTLSELMARHPPSLAAIGLAGDPRVRAVLRSADGHLEVEVVALDSHKPSKYSRHLVLRPHLVPPSAYQCERIPLPLAGSPSAKTFARLVCARLGDRLRVATSRDAEADPAPAPAAPVAEQQPVSGQGAPVGDGALASKPKGGCFIDLGVYTRKRCFRIVGSSKLLPPSSSATPTALTVNDGACERLPAHLSPLSSRPLATQLHASLVVPLLAGTRAWAELTLPEAMADASATAGSSPSQANRPPPPAPSMASPSHPVRLTSAGPITPSASAGPITPSAWVDQWLGLTAQPLLDTSPGIGPAHPFVLCSRRGPAAPPPPLDRLGDWAAGEFGRWGGGASAPCRVRNWQYTRSEFPCERLLHLTAAGTRWCQHRGRQHKSQLVMLSIDLLSGTAWQRCWDSVDCVVHATRASDGRVAMLKAKAEARRPDASVMPTWTELDAFERDTDAHHRGGELSDAVTFHPG